MTVSSAVYLLEVDLWNGSAVETRRYGSHSKTTLPSDTPSNTVYLGKVLDAGQMDRQLSIRAGVFGSASNNPVTITLANLDGAFDGWINADLDIGLDGRAFRLKQINGRDLPVAGAVTLMTGTVRGIDGSNALTSIRLIAADRLADLAKPLLIARYGGTTTTAGPTADGDVDLTGQIVPRVFGTCPHVAPKLVNKFNLIYQVSGSAVASIAAFDGGYALTFTADYPNLVALVAATVPPGQYATCRALGVFRLGAAPAAVITATVVEGATLALRSAARVAQRMLAAYGIAAGDIVTSSFDGFHAFNPAEVGIFIADETSAADALAKVMGSVLGAIFPTETGRFAATWLFDPSSATPVATYSLRDIGKDASFAFLLGADDDATGIPAWRVTTTWGTIWNRFSGGDVIGIVDATTRALLTSTAPRQASPAGAQSAAVLTAHPLAVDLTVDTLLVNQADADAQAALRFNLFRRKRGKIVMPLSFDLGGGRGRPAIGSVIRVQDTHRPALAAGRNYIVIGRKDDFNKRVSSVTVWG